MRTAVAAATEDQLVSKGFSLTYIHFLCVLCASVANFVK